MKKLSACLLLAAFLGVNLIASASAAPRGGGAPNPGPATRPAGDLGYGRERFRLVNQADEIVAVLENGLVVIAKRVSSPAVAVRGYVYTGGVYEGRWLGGGLSHLLEHLVAGGTTERRSEAENEQLLQRIGNNSNAYTTTDHTAYFINTTADHLEEAVDLLTGWLFGAKILKEEYAREYEVVQRELEMGKGEPDRVLYYMAQANRYRVSPARVPVIGYMEVIEGLSRDDVYDYYKLTYQPNNMVISVAGDVDPERMLRAVQQFVADEEPGRVFSRDIAQEPPVTAPRTAVATFPKLGQARLELGFPSIRLDHPDLYALDLLAQYLAGGESSLLVEELRDKRQLASAVSASSYTPTYADGTFAIDLMLEAGKIPEATDAVLELLEQVKQKGVDPDALRRAQTQMKVARVRQMQTSEDIAASLATDFISAGDPHFSDRYVREIGQVTPEQVREVARRYFDRTRLLTTALVPAEFVGAAGLPKAEDLLRQAAPTTRKSDDKTVATAGEVRRTVLDDGTILLTKRIPTSPLVAIQTYALGGVTAEDAKTAGLGNLTMEMLPRGTTTRTAQQIAEFFDSIGGTLQTASGNNSWVWTATTLKEDFDKAFEVYADVVHNPAFPEAEVELMKKRVLAQIASQDADWHTQAMRYFKQQYYGPQNSPYQFMPQGTAENVKSFTPDQLRQWYRQKILPARRVLAVYGDVDPARVELLARKHFGASGGKREAAEPDKLAYNAGKADGGGAGKAFVNVERVEVQKTGQPLAGVVIGFKSDSLIGDPANFPLIVGDTMASGYGYPTGYLHSILRGKGLVYVVHAVNQPGRNNRLPGTFLVYAGAEPKNVTEVVETILENIARLQGTPAEVNEDWYRRSKELITVTDALMNQTPAEQATTAALDELYGLGYNYHDQFADKVKAVGLDDVRRVARQRLTGAVVAISTPMPEAVNVKTGRREYASFPEVDLTPERPVAAPPQ